MDMPQAKRDAMPASSRNVPFSSKENSHFVLQLQLQNEVDRLAVLLEEVKKQTARVQAAADAIGDNVLSNQVKDSLPHGNSRHPLPKTASRR